MRAERTAAIRGSLPQEGGTAHNMGICARVFAAGYWKHKLAG
jgi:hypothetical protein